MIHVQLRGRQRSSLQQVLSAVRFTILLGFLFGRRVAEASIIAMVSRPYTQRVDHHAAHDVGAFRSSKSWPKKAARKAARRSANTRAGSRRLGTMQASFMAISMAANGVFYDNSNWFLIYTIVAMVAGTLFLMWLGEQISRQRASATASRLIIFIGIVLRFPDVRHADAFVGPARAPNRFLRHRALRSGRARHIVSIIFLYQGQRRVPGFSRRAAWSAARCRRPLDLYSVAPSTTPALFRSSSQSRSLLLPSRRSRGSNRGQGATGTGFMATFQSTRWPPSERS